MERELVAAVDRVRRVAGADRYATAAAIAEAFPAPPGSGVSLASGTAFPDALAGARHAAALGQPLLLTDPAVLPSATRAALARSRPPHVDLYGGVAAASDAVTAAVLTALLDEGGPQVTATAPARGATVRHLDAAALRLDGAVDPTRSTVHLEVAGVEVRGSLREAAPAGTLSFVRAPGQAPPGLDRALPARLVARTVDAAGAVHHLDVAFTLREPDPHFADVGPIALALPSRDVDMVGFHEAAHPGAQAQAARPTATPTETLPSRGRGTDPRSAADVVANPDLPVLAPVTGRVVRAGDYVLYCRHTDAYAVIAPDARPAWEVKVLHVHGLQVRAGDRVVAGTTVLAAGPRQLPFDSQVDARSTDRWPHVHVEVVDPAVPTRPGGGC